jgi:drug/metabolite transporter (DMT)-like permease
MTIYLLAWLSSISYGFEGVLTKLSVKHSITNPWHFNFFLQLFMLLTIIPLAIRFGGGMPSQWTYIILGSVGYALGGALYVVAMKKLDVSVLGPLFCFRTVMSVLIGFLFLNETLAYQQYLLIAVIFIAGIFISIDEKFSLKSFFSIGTLIALIDMLVLVFWAACFKQAVPVNGFWTATLWTAVVSQVWLLFSIPFFIKTFKQVKFKSYSLVFITAIAGTAGTVFANAANAKNISITSAITAIPLSMIIAIIFSVVAPELLEKHTHKVYAVRLVAAAIMTAAALGL